MMTTCLSFILMVVAFLVTTFLYPHVLNFARKHNIVDNPSARKLQRVPIPVMGGTAVFIGVVITSLIGYVIAPDEEIIKILGLLMVMYLLGVWDDIKDVSASLRFVVEFFVTWMMVYMLGVEINNFHGLWNTYIISDSLSVPLSLIAGVGIMNAINLIDGVDGYCSSYGVMACTAFAIIFYNVGDMAMFTLALIAIGAIIPFFFHNVFGRTSKMFLGDGGSLMLGTLLALFVFRVLTKGFPAIYYNSVALSLPAVCLAILAVPVFDTLRVMNVRMAKGESPFHPDKTHLHHLFIDMNFSHLTTSATIVLGNIFIILTLLLGWMCELSVNKQTYLVIFCSFLFTWCFYFLMDREHRQNDGEGSVFWQDCCKRGKATNLSTTAFWQFIRKVVDSRLLGDGSFNKTQTEQNGEDNAELQKPRQDPRVNTEIK